MRIRLVPAGADLRPEFAEGPEANDVAVAVGTLIVHVPPGVQGVVDAGEHNALTVARFLMVDTAATHTTLAARLASLDEELAELTAVPRDPATAVSFGKRIGDGTTEAIDRMTKVGTAEQLAVMRADVVRALEKLDDGTYGLCDRCGALIPEERLEARPWSVLCVACASRRAS